MNAATLPPLVLTIDFLRDAAKMPVTDWPHLPHAVDGLPRVMISEAGVAAAMLASSVRTIVRQLPVIEPEAETEMRQLLTSLADVLQHHQNAHGVKPHYIEKS